MLEWVIKTRCVCVLKKESDIYLFTLKFINCVNVDNYTHKSMGNYSKEKINPHGVPQGLSGAYCYLFFILCRPMAEVGRAQQLTHKWLLLKIHNIHIILYVMLAEKAELPNDLK